MKYPQLNGFYAGIVMTMTGPLELLEKKREEWVKEGRICWINQISPQHTQQFHCGE